MIINIIHLLVELEGKINQPYKDFAGYLTIGIGHLLTRDELYSGKIYINDSPVRYAKGLSNDQCYQLLEDDLHIHQAIINSWVFTDINSNQRTALTSFTFNVGVNAFKRSTLLKYLNYGKYEEIPAQMERWIWAGGEQSKILENRRKREIQVWNAPV